MPRARNINLERSLRIFLYLLVFLAPLKFGLAHIHNVSSFWPGFIWDWAFWTWPVELFFFGTMVLGLGYVFWAYREASLSVPYFYVWVAFFVFGIPAVYQSYCVGASIGQALQFMSYAVVWCLCWQLCREETQQRMIMDLISVTALLVVGYGLYQVFFGFQGTLDYLESRPEFIDHASVIGGKLRQGRAFSTFIYPNALAGYLIVVFPLMWVGFLETAKASEKGIYSLLMAATVVVLMFSKSRGGGLVFGIIVFVLLLLFCSRRIVVGFMIFGVMAVSLWFIRNPDYVNLHSLLARFDYWRAAWAMIQDHPMTGIGPGAFSYLYPKYMVLGAEATKSVHNNILQMWVEWGPVPTICFWGFLMSPFIYARRMLQDRLSLGMLVGIFGFIMHSIVDFDLYIPGIVVIVLVYHALICRRQLLNQDRVFAVRHKRAFLAVGGCLIFAGIIYAGLSIRVSYLTYHADEALMRGDMRAAHDFLRKSTAQSVASPFAHFLLGHVYASVGQLDPAIQSYRRGIKGVRNSPELHAALSRTYLTKGRTLSYKEAALCLEEAREEMQIACEQYPYKSLYHAELAWIYRLQRDNENMVRHRDEAVRLIGYERHDAAQTREVLKRLVDN